MFHTTEKQENQILIFGLSYGNNPISVINRNEASPCKYQCFQASAKHLINMFSLRGLSFNYSAVWPRRVSADNGFDDLLTLPLL